MSNCLVVALSGYLRMPLIAQQQGWQPILFPVRGNVLEDQWRRRTAGNHERCAVGVVVT
ncbi:MAG: hypothetical protein ACKPBF_08595 [Actinomycetota bacterium]